MNSGRAGDDDVLVLPPLPADPLFVDAVEDAVAGGSDDLPAAQPQRRVGADPRDFASLYMRHRASFGLHARRFLGDQRDVDEVLQEAFLRLFLAMPELETELQALAYCRRTVTNLCIDRYRADQRRPRLVDLDAIDWDPSDEASYEDPVLRAEDAAIVRQALALLTPMHRAALVKREIEEKSLPQIAEELGIPEDSVKHLLYRARRALRRLLVGTSVEPGADLSNSQLMRLANERLARATLRSANVLIVLFVTAVTVVGALRVGANDQETRSGEVGAVMTPQGGGARLNPAHPLSSLTGSADTKHSHRPSHGAPAVPAPTRPHDRSAVAAVPAPKAERFAHRPSRPIPPTPTHRTSPSYVVQGDLSVTGPVSVHSVAREFGPAGMVSSTTQLIAPTTQGAFVLNQFVNDDPLSGSAEVSLQPVLTTGNDALTLGVQSTSSVTRAADGTLSIDVTAIVDPSETPQTVGSLAAHIVLSADYVHVTSETVTVQAPPADPESSPSIEGVAPAPLDAADTNTLVAPQARPTVIGMSTKGLGDQGSSWSSSTDGGSFPLLPSPPAGP